MQKDSIIYTTIGSLKDAKTLARKLVEKELCFCINIIPNAISIYKWKNEIHEDDEFAMICKIKSSPLDEIISFIMHHHPYEEPVITSLPCNIK